MLLPAIFASTVLVFADVIDDFVLVRYLSGDASTEPVSVKIYNTARPPRLRRSTRWPRCCCRGAGRRGHRLPRVPAHDARRTASPTAASAVSTGGVTARATHRLDAYPGRSDGHQPEEHFVGVFIAVGGGGSTPPPHRGPRGAPQLTAPNRRRSSKCGSTARTREVTVDNRTSLLDMLRERVGPHRHQEGLRSGRLRCLHDPAGRQRINSCLTLAVMHDGAEITTIEGLARERHAASAAAGVHRQDAFQCGYCTPGQIMSGVGCIQEGHTGSPRRSGSG